jgi:poly-gamma-glutamate capsule biosynthesis protein CapA/YwtB (metallophosphatase superfamily)
MTSAGDFRDVVVAQTHWDREWYLPTLERPVTIGRIRLEAGATATLRLCA